MIRAVTFDLDGTLYDHRRVKRPMLWRNLTRLRALRVGRAVREELRAREHASGHALLVEEARVVGERLGIAPAAARALLDAIFRVQLCAVLAQKRDPVTLPALQRLTERNIAIAVVSDRVVDEKLIALGLDALPWAAKLSGDETGVLKPSPRAFTLALSELDVSAAEAVHVGDRDDADGAGARAAGMRYVQVSGPRDLPRVVDEILSQVG